MAAMRVPIMITTLAVMLLLQVGFCTGCYEIGCDHCGAREMPESTGMSCCSSGTTVSSHSSHHGQSCKCGDESNCSCHNGPELLVKLPHMTDFNAVYNCVNDMATGEQKTAVVLTVHATRPIKQAAPDCFDVSHIVVESICLLV